MVSVSVLSGALAIGLSSSTVVAAAVATTASFANYFAPPSSSSVLLLVATAVFAVEVEDEAKIRIPINKINVT